MNPSQKPDIKCISFIQEVGCLIVLLSLLLCCLGNFFSVPYTSYYLDFYDQPEFPEAEKTFAVSPRTVLQSITYILDMKEANSNEYDELYAQLSPLPTIPTESNAGALAITLLQAVEIDLFTALLLWAIAVLTLLIPLTLSVLFIHSLICFLIAFIRKNRRESHRVIRNAFRIIIFQISMIPLFPLLTPRIQLQDAAIILLTVAAIGIIMNVIFSFFKPLTSPQQRYKLMLQIISLLNIGAFIGFYAAVAKSRVIPAVFKLFHNTTGEQLLDLLLKFSFEAEEIFSLFFGTVFFVGLFTAFKALSHNLNRLQLTTSRYKKGESSLGDTYGKSVLPVLLMPATYLLTFNTKLYFPIPDDCIGVFLISMVLSFFLVFNEVLVNILKKTLCMDLGEGGMDLVLIGSTYDNETEQVSKDELAILQRDHQQSKKAAK